MLLAMAVFGILALSVLLISAAAAIAVVVFYLAGWALGAVVSVLEGVFAIYFITWLIKEVAKAV